MHKVLIRPLCEEDALTSWMWRNDTEVWQFTGSKPDKPITAHIEQEWIRKVLKEETSRRFAILVDENYVGNIQLTNIRNGKDAEYHIFIGNKSYWGKGIAHLATSQILHYAKEALSLQSLYLTVDPLNIGAIKTYEKSGFVKRSNEILMISNLEHIQPPLLSVFMMSYNHESFISQALEGILDQKCDFHYNVVIGDDSSKDSTREIILKYSNMYPGKFRLLFHRENIGSSKNQEEVLKNCDGKYIAMCEGDDYWTDPYKLQKQVNFLEANPSINLVSGGYQKKIGTELLDEVIYDSPKHENNKANGGFEFDFYDMRKLWLTKTLTVVFRKNAYPFHLFKQFKYFRDIHIFYYILKNSRGYYFKEVLGVYNIHQGGIHSLETVKVHKTSSYNSYKELYEHCQDEFLRYMYFTRALSLFNHYLYNAYPENTLKGRIKLFIESTKIAKGVSEYKQLLLSFFPTHFREHLKALVKV